MNSHQRRKRRRQLDRRPFVVVPVSKVYELLRETLLRFERDLYKSVFTRP